MTGMPIFRFFFVLTPATQLPESAMRFGPAKGMLYRNSWPATRRQNAGSEKGPFRKVTVVTAKHRLLGYPSGQMTQIIPFRRLLESPGTCPKTANSHGMGKVIPFRRTPSASRANGAPQSGGDKCSTCQYSANSECVPQLCHQ